MESSQSKEASSALTYVTKNSKMAQIFAIIVEYGGPKEGVERNTSSITSDEDIPTTQPSPPTIDDLIVAAKDKSNDEIRIGPIT
jgi:hypothetical protein